MNYGYVPLEGRETVDLDEIDVDNRYCIQLYHHVASVINLKDLNVLEVGSGRGGGADYIKRYLHPKTVVGIDLSNNAVNFCKQNYCVSGLSFRVGNAESLPFEDNSFNAVINVESSHCYGSIDTFLAEVKRVLCQDGYFLFADFRSVEGLASLREKLYQSRLTPIEETNITPNIIKALELDNQRKQDMIQESVHKPLIQLFHEFAGLKGSKIYEDFKSGRVIYQSFVLQKQIN